MLLRSSIPCQWIVFFDGNRLTNVASIRSPTLARIPPVPGRSPNAHVDTSRPPTTGLIADAVTVAFTSPAPVRRRFASRVSTAGSVGPTSFDPVEAVAANAAGPALPSSRRAPPPANTSRRENRRDGEITASGPRPFVETRVCRIDRRTCAQRFSSPCVHRVWGERCRFRVYWLARRRALSFRIGQLLGFGVCWGFGEVYSFEE